MLPKGSTTGKMKDEGLEHTQEITKFNLHTEVGRGDTLELDRERKEEDDGMDENYKEKENIITRRKRNTRSRPRT